MPFTDDQLRAKAEASATSLGTLTAKQREQAVTTTIVDDYNNFRLLVIECKPELERLLPPKIEMVESGYGLEMPNARYQDLQTFFAQIASILKPGNISLGPRRH